MLFWNISIQQRITWVKYLKFPLLGSISQVGGALYIPISHLLMSCRGPKHIVHELQVNLRQRCTIYLIVDQTSLAKLLGTTRLAGMCSCITVYGKNINILCTFMEKTTVNQNKDVLNGILKQFSTM